MESDKNINKNKLNKKINDIIKNANDIIDINENMENKKEKEERKGMIDNIIITSLIIIIIILIIVVTILKHKNEKKSEYTINVLEKFLKRIKKEKNTREKLKIINNVYLKEIKTYFSDSRILNSLFQWNYEDNGYYKNNRYYKDNRYYTYYTYKNNFNERLCEKRLFFKFYTLLKDSLIEKINENKFIKLLPFMITLITFIWATITLCLDTFNIYEANFGEVDYVLFRWIKYMLIISPFIYIPVYISLIVFFVFFVFFMDNKEKKRCIKLKKEVEEILEKLQEEIDILEKIIKLEKELENKISDSSIKEGLELQKCEIEIQKKLAEDELEEIDKFYKKVKENMDE